jgi:hypothetical protein
MTSISRLRPRLPTRWRFLRDVQTRRFGASSREDCTGRKCSGKARKLAGLYEYEVGQLPSGRSIGRHYGLRSGGARGGPALCPWRDDSRTSFCMVDCHNQYEIVGETGQREKTHIGTPSREAGLLRLQNNGVHSASDRFSGHPPASRAAVLSPDVLGLDHSPIVLLRLNPVVCPTRLLPVYRRRPTGLNFHHALTASP